MRRRNLRLVSRWRAPTETEMALLLPTKPEVTSSIHVAPKRRKRSTKTAAACRQKSRENAATATILVTTLKSKSCLHRPKSPAPSACLAPTSKSRLEVNKQLLWWQLATACLLFLFFQETEGTEKLPSWSASRLMASTTRASCLLSPRKFEYLNSSRQKQLLGKSLTTQPTQRSQKDEKKFPTS